MSFIFEEEGGLRGRKRENGEEKGSQFYQEGQSFVCFAVRDISEVEKGRNSEKKKIYSGLKHSYSSGLAPQLPTSTQ